MSFDLAALHAAVARHGAVARVVVVEVRGSAPREVGAAMLVWADGQGGTIGGGRLEWDATIVARETLADGRTRARRYALGPELGQCCGGAVQLAVTRFDADTLPNTGEIATQLEDTPRPETPTHLPALHKGWFFETTVQSDAAVWIFGAGHVGRAIVDTLHKLPNFDITWIDTGPERFPQNAPVRCLPAPDPARALALAPKDAHHLILTYSHEMDLALCHAALTHGFRFAGLIGSQTKWARFRKRLASLGHSEDAVARITCPIGDPSLGRHPQAIALGVVAGLVLTVAATGKNI